MARKYWLLAFCMGLVAMPTVPAKACWSTASYRSVVVNKAPEFVPDGAIMLKVRIDEALYSTITQEIQGIRATTVENSAQIPAGTSIEIREKLASMCDTWIEMWSDDHVSTEGVLTGFVTGYVKRQTDGSYRMTPLVFQRFADRDWSKGPESQSRGKVPDGKRSPVDPNAKWVPFRIDAEKLASNLDETNAAIRKNLDEMEKRPPTTPPSVAPDS